MASMGSAKLWGPLCLYQSVLLHLLIVFHILPIRCYAYFFGLKTCLRVIRLDSNEHGRVENARISSFHKSSK